METGEGTEWKWCGGGSQLISGSLEFPVWILGSLEFSGSKSTWILGSLEFSVSKSTRILEFGVFSFHFSLKELLPVMLHGIKANLGKRGAEKRESFGNIHFSIVSTEAGQPGHGARTRQE